MNKPLIISEIAQGYEGSSKLVELYVKAAKFAGADAIKFQIFFADDSALPDYQYYHLFKGLEIPYDIWGKAVSNAHKYGLEFYSDVAGIRSLKELERIDIDGYKIHTTNVNNMEILREVAKTGKKVFLSTGGCSIDEIDNAIDILNKCDVTLMYGFQAEPTQPMDNNLNRIKTLSERYKRAVGFQDHTEGGIALSFYVSFIALGLGVEVIEKHLTLSRVPKIEDYVSALTPEEFVDWVKIVRKGMSCLGMKNWEFSKVDEEYRKKTRRAVITNKEIKEGEIILERDVTLKRTGTQGAIYDISLIIGKKAKRNLGCNIPVILEDLQ